MNKTLDLFFVFCAIFSQMLFMGENNVVFANILSLPVVISTLVILQKQKFVELTIQIKCLLLLLAFIIISNSWSVASAIISFSDFKPLSLLIIFIICINTILKYHLSITPILIAFTSITLLNFLIFSGVISSSLFFDLNEYNSRFQGSFSNPNVAGIAFLFCIIIIDFFKTFNSYKAKKVINYGFNIIKLMCIVLIIATASKKAVLGLIIYFVFQLIDFRNTIKMKWIVVCFLIFIFSSEFIPFDEIFIFLDGTVLKRFSFFYEQLESNNTGLSQGSTSERLFFVEKGIEGFFNSPLIGNGFKSFSYNYSYYAHNNYIELLYSFGLLGFLIYYRIFYSLWLNVLNNKKQKKILLLILTLLLVTDISLVSYNLKLVQYIICVTLILPNFNHIKSE